ncbi:MAG: hypothetical protein DAHOPDDO_00223 [Ignavibacteriaceae bacterium]|nr:hypothetical protein [Ignavibacteriaceae bacterium]
MGKVFIPTFLSPSTSSISFTISLIRLIKKANTAGIIAAAGLSTTTPPKIKTNPASNAMVKFPSIGIRFNILE